MSVSNSVVAKNAPDLGDGTSWIHSILRRAQGTVEVYVEGSARTYSADDIVTGAAQVAVGLAKVGVSRGDHVALLCEQGYEWIVTDVAVQALGAVSVCLDPLLVDQINWVEYAPFRAMIVNEPSTEQRVAAKVAPAPVAETTFVLGSAFGSLTDPGEYRSWSDLLDETAVAADPLAQLAELAAGLSPSSPATVMWDIGSNGPDGARLTPTVYTHRQLGQTVAAWSANLAPRPDDTCLSVLPLSVLAGRIMGELLPLSTGCTGVIHPELSEHDVVSIRPTVLLGTGPYWQRMADSLDKRIRGLRPEPESWWAVRAGLICPAALLTLVQIGLSGTTSENVEFVSAVLAVVAAVVTVGVPLIAERTLGRGLSALTFVPGIFSTGFLIVRQISGALSWTQLLSFLFGFALVCSTIVLVATRLKWWNARLWIRDRGERAKDGRVRNALWAAPIRRLIGLDRCRLPVATLIPLADPAIATLDTVGLRVREFETGPDGPDSKVG